MNNTAVWGLIGTAVGALIASPTQLLMHRLSSADRETSERRLAAEQGRAQRGIAYLRLLQAARELRYQARSAPTTDAEKVDSLRTELSTVNYEIKIIASPEMAAQAEQVRRKTLDYLNSANSQESADEQSGDEQSEKVESAREGARQAVADFIEAAKWDLKVGGAA